MNANYLVGVWVGNASGEGRPELTGVGTASPVMLEIFQWLAKNQWFVSPKEDLQQIEVCAISGMLASDICPKKLITTAKASLLGTPCKYHKWVHLSPDHKWQVTADCQPISAIDSKSWFVLPPLMEWFYRKGHPTYLPLPPLREDCQGGERQAALDFIYPKNGTVLHQAKGFGGEVQPIVARVAYKHSGKLFWYLDETYLGETLHFHDMQLQLSPGEHLLRCMDTQGNEKTISIIVND